MKILFFIVFISLFVFNNSYSDEHIDCTQFNKLSIKFLDCKTKQLKSKLNENQSKTKKKISETTKNLKSKIETSGTKKKVDNVLKTNDN